MKKGKIYLIGISLVFIACQHEFVQEKYVQNNSSDTIFVINPDRDSVYLIPPSKEAMVYTFKVLDSKQSAEPCRWLGDSLIIRNESGVSSSKKAIHEGNWTSSVTGEKDRFQRCVMTISDADF